ncbi:COP9 signalosome complex subunit 7 [Zea mays]|uniref:COP9 signalosome complex subunit 7 n=1 Tax=Zea mays TaxID=4577 RepID=A0A1R3NEP2_MAIZE|nr:COP9 signalosome complex subunit 7 [Zea mays]
MYLYASLGNSGSLPTLLPDEVRKLKQLSVLPLVESTKILPYDQLMQELDVSNVRELEDFLINECMYSVQFAAGRDLTPDQLNNMIEILSDWFGTSDSLLHQIQEKIKWADTMSDVNKKHRKEFEDRVEEAKKSIKADIDIRGHDDYLSESVGIMDFEEDRVRPKR